MFTLPDLTERSLAFVAYAEWFCYHQKKALSKRLFLRFFIMHCYILKALGQYHIFIG